MDEPYSDELESLWDALLSRQPELIREAYAGLSAEEQGSLLAHLRRMAEEPGWHAEQRTSARAALEVIHNTP